MFSAVPPIADILGGRVVQLREEVPFHIQHYAKPARSDADTLATKTRWGGRSLDKR
jgi:hypothetical protein